MVYARRMHYLNSLGSGLAESSAVVPKTCHSGNVMEFKSLFEEKAQLKNVLTFCMIGRCDI